MCSIGRELGVKMCQPRYPRDLEWNFVENVSDALSHAHLNLRNLKGMSTYESAFKDGVFAVLTYLSDNQRNKVLKRASRK